MKKILVVDDNPDNMDLFVEILEDAGYEPIEYEDAETGLLYLEQHDVDLVLMDVSLPKMNGLEATRLIKASAKTKALPVFLVSAHAMPKDIEAGKKVGCDGYLTKPIDEDQLLSHIASALGINDDC